MPVLPEDCFVYLASDVGLSRWLVQFTLYVQIQAFVTGLGPHYTGSSEADERVLITGQTDAKGNRKLF